MRETCIQTVDNLAFGEEVGGGDEALGLFTTAVAASKHPCEYYDTYFPGGDTGADPVSLTRCQRNRGYSNTGVAGMLRHEAMKVNPKWAIETRVNRQETGWYGNTPWPAGPPGNNGHSNEWKAGCSTVSEPSAFSAQCDEFPNATMSKGGEGIAPQPALAWTVGPSENQKEGGFLDAFFGGCGVVAYERPFLVVPTATLLSPLLKIWNTLPLPAQIAADPNWTPTTHICDTL